MITILERPQGHILDTTAKTATVSESYGAGDAQFVVPTVHGLTDGDYIYSVSDIEDYAGFFYVDVTTTGIFKLKTSANGDYVQFIASGSITYYESNLTHGWSAVHLPITYKLSSNLYPLNESDSSQTISSVVDYNGLSVIHISGSLGSGVNTYDFIKLTLPNDTDYSGIYQILEFISPTVLVINLDYDSTINWTSASALKHYNNYNILVRVYAGLNASHEWASIKPYELAATLELIPDDNNECFFSINEILKSYITTRNNLGLGTLPNNIDFMTMFYIETAESYDDSDGYVFGTATTSFTSDQSNFEGYAVNAKLEFKNLYSGYLSEYIMTNSAAKFLTLFSIPVLFSCSDDLPNCYSDISFINPYPDFALTVKKEYYLSGDLQSTVNTSLGVQDEGVIRAELNADCDADRVDVTVTAVESYENGDFEDQSLTGWTQEVGLSVQPVPPAFWAIDSYLGNYGALFQFNISYDNPTPQTYHSKYIVHEYVQIQSTAKEFTYSVRSGAQTLTDGTWGTASFRVGYYKDGVLVATEIIIASMSADTSYSGTFTTDATDFDEVKFYIRVATVPSVFNLDLFEGTWDFYVLQAEPTTLPSYNISETKQIKIQCGCANQELRLTWLNNLGGFDYWNFTGKKDDVIEIQSAIETKKNILPQWPKSYGSTSDTIRKQTARISNKAYTVRSQFLTEDEADAIAYIKSSVIVQIINSRLDRRTVIVDTDSFIKRKDGDKTFEIAFNISFTDDIPSQTV